MLFFFQSFSIRSSFSCCVSVLLSRFYSTYIILYTSCIYIYFVYLYILYIYIVTFRMSRNFLLYNSWFNCLSVRLYFSVLCLIFCWISSFLQFTHLHNSIWYLGIYFSFSSFNHLIQKYFTLSLWILFNVFQFFLIFTFFLLIFAL